MAKAKKSGKKAAKKGNGRKMKHPLLKEGDKAPSFKLPASSDKKVALSSFLGRPVVLVFYPADFSPVCTDQLSLYSEIMPQFAKYNAQFLGISVDSVWSHAAFAKERGITFPLLSDFEPKGKVSKKFGAYRKKEGMSSRALYVLDPKGKVFWRYLSPLGVNPGADGILKALEALKNEA